MPTRLERGNERIADPVTDLLERQRVRIDLVDRVQDSSQAARRSCVDLPDVPVEKLHAVGLRPKKEEDRPKSVPRAA
jgi:hypothetical protein